MTKDELKEKIRALTRRIGEARHSGDGAALRDLRRERTKLACTLAREFDEWLLVNPEGHTEFVPYPEYAERMGAWLARQEGRPRPDLN